MSILNKAPLTDPASTVAVAMATQSAEATQRGESSQR